MNTRNVFWRLTTLLVTVAIAVVHAADVGEQDISTAARKWIADNAIFQLESPDAFPKEATQLAGPDGELLPLWRVDLAPAGYLIMSSDDTLPPVVAFNTQGSFEMPTDHPLPHMLNRQGEIFQNELGKPRTRGNEQALENQARWNALLNRTRAASATPSTIVRSPMLTTEWDQNAPYNHLCPSGSNYAERSVTGCVALAVAQMLKYHEWPAVGTGTKASTDTSGDVTASLKADFSVPYDWSAMADSYAEKEERDYTAAELAVARLAMEMGVLAEADYGLEATSAYSHNLHTLMAQYLGYSSAGIYSDTRSGYTGYVSQSTLFSRIRADMTAGRPAFVSYEGHTFIADGLGTMGGQDYYHFNYGWGGNHNGWYLLTDGYDSTVIVGATTNIQPSPVAVIKPMSCEQTSSFTLSWDFPKRLAADAFRLTRTTGTRASTVISSSISGTARSYTLTGQSGTATYTLEAKVGGSWQAVSDGVTVTVKTAPAAMPTLAIDDGLKSIAGKQATTTIAANNTLTSLTVTSSRPDILPASGITVSGSGTSRTVKLTPSSGAVGNVLLYVTATDAAGNTVSQTVPLAVMADEALTWHTTKAEAMAAATESGKLVLLVGGRNTCPNTNYFRNTVCETSDIKAKIIEDFELCYINIDMYPDEELYMDSKFKYVMPIISVIDPSYQDRYLRHHEGFMSIEETRIFLNNDCHFILIDDVRYFIHDGIAEIIDYNNSSTSELVIPEKIDGNLVTKIGYNAFRDCSGIISIILPDEITSIEDRAFMGCVNLTSIKIPNSVKTIGKYAFAECSSLHSLEFPNSVTSISDHVIYNCKNLSFIKIPESIVEIHQSAFERSGIKYVLSNNTYVYDWFANNVYWIGYVGNNVPAVTILAEDAYIESINIIGPNILSGWETKSYTCTAIWNDGNVTNSTPFLNLSSTDYASLISNQVTNRNQTSSQQIVSLNAVLNFFDDVKTDEKVIRLNVEEEMNYTPVSAFEYTVNENNYVTITKFIGKQKEVIIPSAIDGKPITAIGESAFAYNTDITSVIIKNNIVGIGVKAFYSCDNLASIVLSDNITNIGYSAFEKCYKLISFTIPEDVTNIPSWCFYECSSLETIYIGKKLASIEGSILSNCHNLTAFQVDSENKTFFSQDGILFTKDMSQIVVYPPAKKQEEFILPNTVKSIKEYAFSDCSHIESIIIPESVTTIGHSAFYYCVWLQSIVLPKGITSIDSYTFSYCRSLKSILIPEGVTSIGEGAFYNCIQLESVRIPESVRYIGSETFRDCHNLQSVVISEGVTTIGKSAFYACTSLQSVGIPEGVTAIGETTFCNCNCLQSIDIPDSVTSINNNTFGDCSALKTISIGKGVTSIADTAFINCPELDSVLTDNQYVIDWFAKNMPHVKVESRHIDQTLELKSGWNWVSFQTLPTSHKVGDVLGTSGFTTNDVIQSSAGSSRFNGTSWIPSSFTLEYGKLYMVYVSKPVSVTLTGAESGSSTISVSSGWNWIANPTSTAVTPSQLTHSGGWTAGDCIQGASGSVTHSGSKWIPSTGFYLEPGKGYQIRSSKAGTISF